MNGEFKKDVVTWWVISLFLHSSSAPRGCADFGDSTDLFRLKHKHMEKRSAIGNEPPVCRFLVMFGNCSPPTVKRRSAFMRHGFSASSLFAVKCVSSSVNFGCHHALRDPGVSFLLDITTPEV